MDKSLKHWQCKPRYMPKDPSELNEEDFFPKLNNNLHFFDEKVRIKILTIPIGEGGVNHAYRIHDLTRNKFMIGKISKQNGDEEGGAKSVM